MSFILYYAIGFGYRWEEHNGGGTGASGGGIMDNGGFSVDFGILFYFIFLFFIFFRKRLFFFLGSIHLIYFRTKASFFFPQNEKELFGYTFKVFLLKYLSFLLR